MVIVDPPSCCYLKLNIPHGIVSLEQVWGKHTGQLNPGYHCCYCSYKRIAAMITKNSIQFNTPIETCPTKDNVRVSVDIGITFHIGKEETRAKDCEMFLYYLGANKLEELLEQESEESIRNFVRRYKVNQIRDIKSEMTSTMKEELNKKFNPLGVYIEKVNVTNVIIPIDLRIALQQATAYDVFLQNQVKYQENLRLRMMNEENKTLQTLKRENQKKMLELNNNLAMEEIYLEKFKVSSETAQQIAIIKAMQNREIKIIKAEATKNLAEQRAKKRAEAILAEAKAYSEAKTISTLAKKNNLTNTALTRFEVAKLRSQGQIKEAEAETAFASNMEMKRKFEQKMKKADGLKSIMADNKVIISGKNGEELMKYFDETLQMVDQMEDKKLSTDSNTERKNIKKSLEREKQESKQKFEDPFFIKISENMSTQNLKIVKQKKKDDNDCSEDEASSKNKRESQHSTISQGFVRPSIRNPGTVIEALEEEEYSPKLRGTRNLKDNTKAIIKLHNQEVYSESENFEKVSDNTPKVKTVPQLVKLDINLDTLKNFLEDIQEAINDHAKTIGLIQTDMKKKANEKTIGHYFLKISEGLHKECGERPHAFRLENDQSNYLSENFQTEDSVLLKRQAEKVSEKFEIIGLNIINLQKFRNTTEDRLEKLERLIPKCFTIDQFREESQAQEQRTLKYINEQLGTFQENLNGYKKELNEALTFFEKKVNDNQSETLWRIKDCEELLRSRVSDKYVNDAIKSLEEKLIKQVNYNDEKQVERLEKSFKELGIRVNQTNTFFNEKFDDLRKIIAMYDQKIQSFATNEKLASVQTGYRDMKYNIEREMELLQEHVKETKDKIGELNKRFSNLEIATNSLANGGDFTYQMAQHGATQHQQQNHSNQGSSRNHYQNNTTIDKQNKSQSSIKKGSSPPTKGKHEEQNATLGQSPGSSSFSPLMRKRQNRAADAAFQAELERRIHQFEEEFEIIDNKFENMKRQIDEKITKEDVRKLTSDKITKEDLEHIIPNEEINQEKMKYLIREEIETLQNKISDQFKQFDNKIIRLRAELDIHSIMRQLDRKANEEQVRSDFSNHEFKIGTLDRNIIRMAQDFETFQMAITKIHSAIVELQDANRDVLLGKKTTNCLSCGKGGDTVQTIKGKDGKLYKAAEQEKVKLSQDDSNIIGSHYQMYDIHQTPLTLNQHFNYGSQTGIEAGSQNEFFRMRPSQSFYESGVYESQKNNISSNNLPSVNEKKNTYGNGVNILKNMASHAGISSTGHTATQSQSISFSQSNKRKLPFGFQVQQEKKELFKVGQRGKSSQNAKRMLASRGQDGRPESASNREHNRSFNFNQGLSDNL